MEMGALQLRLTCLAPFCGRHSQPRIVDHCFDFSLSTGVAFALGGLDMVAPPPHLFWSVFWRRGTPHCLHSSCTLLCEERTAWYCCILAQLQGRKESAECKAGLFEDSRAILACRSGNILVLPCWLLRCWRVHFNGPGQQEHPAGNLAARRSNTEGHSRFYLQPACVTGLGNQIVRQLRQTRFGLHTYINYRNDT